MNDNIDLRMANYLSILSNDELRKKFDPSVIHNIESALSVYAATTCKEYLDAYKAKKEQEAKVEEVRRMFR